MSDRSSDNTVVESPGPAATPPERQIISLQAGEAWFTTTSRTLCKESAFFRCLLSDPIHQRPDGSFFADIDPELFPFVLRYLRHGVYPIFHDPDTGYGTVKYWRIGRVAVDLGIEKLAKWIADEKYRSLIEYRTVGAQERDGIRPLEATERYGIRPCGG